MNRYSSTGEFQNSFTAFDPAFVGGVRTVSADFNGDGTPDVVIGSGPGAPAQVAVIDGATFAPIFTNGPFELSFTGGVFVSVGDITGDGVPDVVITPDEGGGPRVRVFDGTNFAQIIDFFGIQDPNFRGGARSAIGDVDGDGIGDLLVAAGFQGGPRVAVWDGNSLTAGNPLRLFNDFFAFEQSLRNGVYIAAGDLNGDGKAEVIAGGGPSGGPRVLAYSGAALLNNQRTVVANFFAGDPANRGGIRIAVRDFDGDNLADLVAGAGVGAGSRVTGYFGKTIALGGTPDAAFAFDAFDGFGGGVYVG